MSILVTVAELQERFRRDCGLPAFTTSTNITTSDALDYVKRSAQKLSGFIDQQGAGEQYLTTNTDLTTVVDIPIVSMPSNALNLIRVAIVSTDGRERQLEPAKLDDWNPDTSGDIFTDYADVVPKYRVIGNTITLFPTPKTARTLRVYYTLGFVVTSTSDTLALRPNWDEYIVANCCVLVRNRQEKSAAEFLEERDRCMSAIASQIKRDRAGIRQVRDVRGNFLDYFGRNRWRF